MEIKPIHLRFFTKKKSRLCNTHVLYMRICLDKQRINAIELEGLESLKLSDGSELQTGPATIDSQTQKFIDSGKEEEGVYIAEWADGIMGLPPVEIVSTPKARIVNGESPLDDSGCQSVSNNSSAETENSKGYGFYLPKFTANLSANAGVAADLGLFGGSFNYAGATVIGLNDGDFYFAGHNRSNDIGQEVNREYTINVGLLGNKTNLITNTALSPVTSALFSTGFSAKEVRTGGIDSEPVKTTNTSYLLFFLYSESSTDHLTGKVSNEIGISYDMSIGAGLVINAGFKWPIYKE